MMFSYVSLKLITRAFYWLSHILPQTGEELIDGNHYASHEIEARIETLDAHWQNLSEK